MLGLCSPKSPCDSSLWLGGGRGGSGFRLPPVVGGLLGPPECMPFIPKLSWQSRDGREALAGPSASGVSFLLVGEVVVIRTIPKKKICKKAKRLSQEALQIAEKRREVKDKGEEERYPSEE